MKKMLLTLSLAMVGAAAVAAPVQVPVTEISTIGNGNAIKNGAALIADGEIPLEGSAWNGDKSAYWSGNGKSKVVTFDFGQEYEPMRSASQWATRRSTVSRSAAMARRSVAEISAAMAGSWLS